MYILCLLAYNCSFLNLTNSGILAKLKAEMLRTYPYNGLDTEIKAFNEYICFSIHE